MSQPHKCPVCNGGDKKITGGCPACRNTGVVWEPEEAAQGADDALEINGL